MKTLSPSADSANTCTPPHPSRQSPHCTDCRHNTDAREDLCNHPSVPVDGVTGRPQVHCAAARGTGERFVAHPFFAVCGQSASLFSPLPSKDGGANTCTASAKKFDATDIDRLMVEAFFEGRDPRSKEYRQGVRVILSLRLQGIPMPVKPYSGGTAQADAYFSGFDEGHVIARRELGLSA